MYTDHGQWLILLVRELRSVSHARGGHIATRAVGRIVQCLVLFETVISEYTSAWQFCSTFRIHI